MILNGVRVQACVIDTILHNIDLHFYLQTKKKPVVTVANSIHHNSLWFISFSILVQKKNKKKKRT